MASKRMKALEKRAELAQRRAARGKIDDQIKALKGKLIASTTASARLGFQAKIANLEYQKAQMPLRS